MKSCLTLMLALAWSVGCAKPYIPKNSPRVATTHGWWGASYVKDGRTYPGGFFGGGLRDAVADNPRALGLAKSARNRSALGFVTLVGGLLCANYGYWRANDAAQDNPDYEWTARDYGVTYGCLGIALAGSFVLTDGFRKRGDAINVYNDWVDAGKPGATSVDAPAATTAISVPGVILKLEKEHRTPRPR